MVLPEIEGQGFFELLDHVSQSGESFISRESAIQLQREPGAPLEERFVDFVYQPILDEDKKVVGIFAHGVDITEQVRARREAENANRAKDEFLATLSHELRTPLASIMGWATLLQNEKIGPAERAVGLHSIERNARVQAQLIEDILDVSRMIAGKMRLNAKPLFLREIIDEALNAILPAAQAKNVRFQRIFDEDAGLVLGDAMRLQQIVSNLLSNALKFTPENGKVEVALKRIEAHSEEPSVEKTCVEMKICDSGIGIAPETLPYVFDRFRQADSSSTRAQGGLGLGLAIVQHLVELHGGSIAVQSDGLGRGTIFTVKLPLLAKQTDS